MPQASNPMPPLKKPHSANRKRTAAKKGFTGQAAQKDAVASKPRSGRKANVTSADPQTDQVLNALPSQIVVVSQDGKITTANHAWLNARGTDSTACFEPDNSSSNYLQMCRHAAKKGSSDATNAVTAISAVL